MTPTMNDATELTSDNRFAAVAGVRGKVVVGAPGVAVVGASSDA